MRVRARISFAADGGIAEVLQRHEMKVRIIDQTGVIHLYVDDSRYSEVLELLKSRNARPIIFKEPIFTEMEIEAAEYFEMMPKAQWGYPQPEDDHEYERMSFDKSTACPHCGQGMLQTSPYLISGRPEFGKNDIIALFWTYDYLVTEKLKSLMENANLSGVEFWPLYNSMDTERTNPMAGVYQLYIAEELPPAASSTEFPVVDRLPGGRRPCECGKLGRNFPTQFHYRRQDLDGVKDFGKTHEWLGGGFDTSRATIVSRRVYSLFKTNKIQGVEFSVAAIDD